MKKNLYYFVSDVHLGLDHKDPVARERKFAAFLKGLPENTKALYLLGDIFDFWYEYRYVVPTTEIMVNIIPSLPEASDA